MTESDEFKEFQNIWEGSKLVIPKYQRRYSWEEEQMLDFKEDIDYIRRQMLSNQDFEKKPTHYFGTFVIDLQGEADLPTKAGKTWDKYHVVDGQQRIITSAIFLEVLREISEVLLPRLEETDEEITQETIEEIHDVYVEQYGKSKIELKNPEDSNFFKKLVYDQETPKKAEFYVDNDKELLPSQKRLVKAKKMFRSYIIEEILQEIVLSEEKSEKVDDIYTRATSESEDRTESEYYPEEKNLDAEGALECLELLDQEEADSLIDQLITIKQVISERLTCTEYEIASSNEAGRIFQSINDRGKDLTLADKIKSYLIYVAARLEEPDLSEKIFTVFGKIADTITTYGNEETIDSFITDHWKMWTGEVRYDENKYEINDVHRRVKSLKKHASLERNDSDLKEWIDAYVTDLERSVKAYQRVVYPSKMGPEVFGENQGKEIRRKIKGIHRCSDRDNVATILTSAYLAYDYENDLTETDFLQIAELLEKMAFRIYSVCDVRSSSRRDKLGRLSHRLKWMDKEEDLKELFSTQERDFEDIKTGKASTRLFEDRESAVEHICRALENGIGNYGNDNIFIKNLKRKDVLKGRLSQENWSGIGKNSLRHFFWEYEYYLRNRPQDNMPQFEETTQRHLEHIWPDNKDVIDEEKKEAHEQNKDSLGNLVLLHPSDNTKLQDKPYPEKHEEVYEDNDMKQIRNLPSPDEIDSWDVDNIRERRKDLIEFAKERWAVETYAVVKISNREELTKELKNEIVSQVRSQFKGTSEFDEINNDNLPAVKVMENPPNDLKRKDSCENCGEDKITVQQGEEGEEKIVCSSCEEEGPIPYKMKVKEYPE
ncbi:MAG: DUF262 domain-containing protein [Candidatus Nanohaloarchaea archaeon]